jgi:uncharacterized membrane protein
MKATQGETKELNVSVNRGKYFKQDVTLQIKASEGISVQPTQVTVRASERPQVHLRVEVPNKAALGDYKIYIKAMPETGEATSSEYNVKVVAPGS